MINIVLTVAEFVLVKGVFLMLFARESDEFSPFSRLDASKTLQADLDPADYAELSEMDMAA